MPRKDYLSLLQSPSKIDRDAMLSLMGDDLHGSSDARTARAARIAKAQGFTIDPRPGQLGHWYDRAEVLRAAQGKKERKAA